MQDIRMQYVAAIVHRAVDRGGQWVTGNGQWTTGAGDSQWLSGGEDCLERAVCLSNAPAPSHPMIAGGAAKHGCSSLHATEADTLFLLCGGGRGFVFAGGAQTSGGRVGKGRREAAARAGDQALGARVSGPGGRREGRRRRTRE